MIIDSPANPVVKALRSLEQAKHRKDRRLFLVEGVRAVEDGLRAGYWPEICLYSPELLAHTERGAKLLKELTSHKVQSKQDNAPTEATPRALEAASATLHPQGVVAAFPMIEWESPSLPKGTTPLVLVCDNIQDPGNLGTILRTAEAAGVQAVWLSPQCADLYNPKVVRGAMGAHFRLPVYATDWPDIERDLGLLGIGEERIIATDANAQDTYDVVHWTLPGALVISNEAHGLSDQAAKLAEHGRTIAVPMAGGTESLNAATAAAIILFEAARQRRQKAEGSKQA